jgi:hypothetical protein
MNERLTLDQWIEIIKNHAYHMPLVPVGASLLYKGKKVIFKDSYILLFEKCEYCGTNSLNSYNICNSCGASV